MKTIHQILGLALIAASSSAMAAETLTTTAPGASPRLIDSLTASYANVIYGPSILSPLSPTQPNNNDGGDGVFSARGGDPLRVKNYLSLGYKFTPKVTLAPVLYWNMYSKGAGASGDAFKVALGDSYLKLSHSSLVSNGGFNLYGDIRVAAPTSDASQANTMITYLLSKQISSYELPGTRWSASVTTSQLMYFFSKYDTAKAARKGAGALEIELYAGPQIEYRISPSLQAFLLLDVIFHKYAGKSLDLAVDGTDIEPGVSWDITPNINFSPFLDFKTYKGIRAETTSINAAFSWKLL